MLPFSPTRLSCTPFPVPRAVNTSGGGGAGVGTGVGEEAGMGVAVGATVGRAGAVTGLDPHAAMPTAAIAVPMMVVSFMAATHSTGARHQQLHPRQRRRTFLFRRIAEPGRGRVIHRRSLASLMRPWHPLLGPLLVH